MRESETFLEFDLLGDPSGTAIGNRYPSVVLDLAELDSIDAARLAVTASATPRLRLNSNPTQRSVPPSPIQSEEPAMATSDKAKNSAQQAKGKVKEAAGKATGNDKLQAKGKADQTKGNLKQAGENVKDAFKR